MSNPKNEFENFFAEGGEKIAEKFQPAQPPEHIIDALIALVGERPKFYRDPVLRIMVCNGIASVTDYMMKEVAAGRRPNIHLGTAAFMMLLGDRMASTYEQYASEEERERYPFNPGDETEEEMDEEFGD